MGDGKEGGIISAIISNFTTPGILFNKPAIECSVDEIKQEVWAQLKAHLNDKLGKYFSKKRYKKPILT